MNAIRLPPGVTIDQQRCGTCDATLADCHADRDSGGDGCCDTCCWQGHRPADGPTGTVTAPPAVVYADDRAETDPCERGTVGCPVRHAGSTPCETW